VEEARAVILFGSAPNLNGLGLYSLFAIGVAWAGFAWFKNRAADSQMSPEPTITADRLGICYQVYDVPHDRLKQAIIPRLARVASAVTARAGRQTTSVGAR
jgi:hypothetical protein